VRVPLTLPLHRTYGSRLLPLFEYYYSHFVSEPLPISVKEAFHAADSVVVYPSPDKPVQLHECGADRTCTRTLPRPPGVRHNSFAERPPGFTVLALRLPFVLRLIEQPYPPFSLVSGFCSYGPRLCCTTFSPVAISGTGLCFAILGGKYP